MRRDAAGSVYLDETVVGFFEAGRPYVIEHVQPRPDTTTVISLRPKTTPRFERSAIRASGPIHFAHRLLLRRLNARERSDLAIEEAAVRLVDLTLDAVEIARDLAHELEVDRFSDDVVVAVAEYIRENFKCRITLDEIADYAGYSVFHLCRLFRNKMKTSIHQYILHLRLESAQKALLESRDSVTAIAYAHGFASHAHFSSQFVRWSGIPPATARHKASVHAPCGATSAWQ